MNNCWGHSLVVLWQIIKESRGNPILCITEVRVVRLSTLRLEWSHLNECDIVRVDEWVLIDWSKFVELAFNPRVWCLPSRLEVCMGFAVLLSLLVAFIFKKPLSIITELLFWLGSSCYELRSCKHLLTSDIRSHCCHIELRCSLWLWSHLCKLSWILCHSGVELISSRSWGCLQVTILELSKELTLLLQIELALLFGHANLSRSLSCF